MSCTAPCAPISGSATRRAQIKDWISFKLDSRKLDELPAPRPLVEILVYSPRMEGVHLRGGRVARGGIRWSDRREDFRTEILGLMKTQMVKNAVIVPVGSKGGFYVKKPPVERHARAGPGRGHRLLPDPDPRPARPHRQLHRRVGAKAASRVRRTWCATTATIPISWSRPTRAPRASPTSPMRSPASTASGSTTPSPRAARPATTTRRWASPPAAPGNR